jgi:ribonuclease HI
LPIGFPSNDCNHFYDYNIFIDGSKTDTKVGTAFCVYENIIETHSEKYRIGELCSIFQAELIGIQKSLGFLNNKFNTEISDNNVIKVCINTDSQIAILAIKQQNNSHPIVNEIVKLINSINGMVRIDIKWIRGHTGIRGNERADVLAKDTSELDINQSIYDMFPLSFAKRHFRKTSLNKWQNQSLNTTKASQTKQFFSKHLR